MVPDPVSDICSCGLRLYLTVLSGVRLALESLLLKPSCCERCGESVLEVDESSFEGLSYSRCLLSMMVSVAFDWL